MREIRRNTKKHKCDALEARTFARFVANELKFFRAELLRIVSGGDLPACWSREQAILQLQARIRGYSAKLRSLTPPPPLPRPDQLRSVMLDARALIRESRAFESTTGPPRDVTNKITTAASGPGCASAPHNTPDHRANNIRAFFVRGGRP
jgi:hypothetical protein